MCGGANNYIFFLFYMAKKKKKKFSKVLITKACQQQPYQNQMLLCNIDSMEKDIYTLRLYNKTDNSLQLSHFQKMKFANIRKAENRELLKQFPVVQYCLDYEHNQVLMLVPTTRESLLLNLNKSNEKKADGQMSE